MRILVRATLFALTYTASCQAYAQSLSDLNLLSESVWSISLQHPDTNESFANAISKTLKVTTIKDTTDVKIPKDWARNAKQLEASISKYSHLDSIKCTLVNVDGISRFRKIIEEHGKDAIQNIPRFMSVFLSGLNHEVLAKDLVSIQSCIGSFHPNNDMADYNNWNEWYDKLEEKFRKNGMKVNRRPSTSDSYVSGFLSGKGSVCEKKSCIHVVAPHNVKLAALNTNQATITIVSFSQR